MGFKLRSGNGPLQFKQMGSSPAKDLSSTMGAFNTADKDDVKSDLKTSDLSKGLSSDNKKAGINKPEGLLTGGKDKTVKEVASKAPKDKVDKTSTEDKPTGDKKKNWVGRTLEKGKKLQTELIGEEGSEKRARYKDKMAHLTNVASRMGELNQPDVATDNVEKHQASKQSAEAHKMKMENFERNALATDQKNILRQKNIDLMNESEGDKNKVPSTNSASQTATGDEEINKGKVGGKKYRYIDEE